MDDKTAEIPSLKDFKKQNRERSAQEKRRDSMQTKSAKDSQSRGTRYESKSDVDRPQHRSTTGSRYADSSQSRQRNVGERAQRAKKKSAPAPRTYARQRNADNETIARTQVVNTRSASASERPVHGNDTHSQSTQAQHRARTEKSKTPSRTSNNQQADAARRTSRPQKSVAPNGKGSVPSDSSRHNPKKSKRPLSPGARKFRRIMGYIGLLLIVIIIGVILSLTVLFKTESINVSGNGDYSKKEIISASGLIMGDNIFTAPKNRASEKIEKAYPYIEEADVYSVFPNAINIDITMAEPACIIEGLGGYYVVSDKGKVLEVASTTDEIDAPVIEGVKVEGKVAGEYVEYGSDVIGAALEEMFNAFSEVGCTKITAINITAEEDAVEIKYVYDNRIVVYLGIPEHLTYKIHTAHTIITEKIDIGGTMIAGDLDVSMCHDSMKSYFNQYTLLSPNSAPAATEPTEATEVTEPTQIVYY